jgi:hypothetical protein
MKPRPVPLRARRVNRVVALAILACLPGVLSPAFADTASRDSIFDHPADAAQLARDLSPALGTVRGARTLRGTYVQKKRLHELPHPLVAEGTFLFVRDLGIAWRTEKPFPSELVITANDILQRDGGNTTMRISADRQPGVRTVAAVFFAVFALDFDALANNFELYSRGAGDGPGSKRWQLGLKPRGKQAGAVREIVVSGRTQVEDVHLAEANGDTTDLSLKGKPSADAPTAEEQQRFAP